MELESDSLLVELGIVHRKQNLLEVREVLRACISHLDDLSGTSIHFIRNQANRVGHKPARMPFLVYCHNDFTSLPTCLVEAIMLDSSF